jgi:hypothetical protein
MLQKLDPFPPSGEKGDILHLIILRIGFHGLG